MIKASVLSSFKLSLLRAIHGLTLWMQFTAGHPQFNVMDAVYCGPSKVWRYGCSLSPVIHSLTLWMQCTVGHLQFDVMDAVYCGPSTVWRYGCSVLWVIQGLTLWMQFISGHPRFDVMDALYCGPSTVWRYGCILANTERVHEAVVTGHISATESRQQSKIMVTIREWLLINLRGLRPFIQNKENGSQRRPCETPQQMGTGAELQSLTATVWEARSEQCSVCHKTRLRSWKRIYPP